MFPSFDVKDLHDKSDMMEKVYNEMKKQLMKHEDDFIFSILDGLSPPPCSICGKDVTRDNVLSDNCPECIIRSVLET